MTPRDHTTALQNFDDPADPAAIPPRLAALRTVMAKQGIDAFLVPRADAHRGEAVPPGQERLAFITGFTGSAGIAVIGAAKAALFVDSRYTLQAPAQTSTRKVTVLETPAASPAAWIVKNFKQGARIAYDPWLHTPGEIKSLIEKLAGHAILAAHDNLVDAIWTDRPDPPQGGIALYGANKMGVSATRKLSGLRTGLATAGADATILTLPESLCWLFNMRGGDVPNAPFVLGFAIVPRRGLPTLFFEKGKLTAANRTAFKGLARLKPMAALLPALEKLGAAKKAVWLDSATCPAAIASALQDAGAILIEKRDPVLLPKAKKNATEIDGMRTAHRADAIAIIKFLCWFDTEAPGGKLTEIHIAKKLEAFRSENPALAGLSFDTISGAGPNGAIVHYRVSEKTNRRLKPGELMLIDSGGQYVSDTPDGFFAGTTDITRTLFTGTATDTQKAHFTAVLKGMIAVSLARFPKGTTGAQIDVLARQFLWQRGLTYTHGTGHGVGAWLSVHEGPAGIAPRYTNVPLEAGMVLSNEPGFYLEGEYGIRIENLVLVQESPVNGDYLDFETLTHVPIDTRLIDFHELTRNEIEWLNAYHKRIWHEIGPALSGAGQAWLRTATEPI